MRFNTEKFGRNVVTLHALVDKAVGADPRDAIIGPFGDGHFSSLFGIVPDVLAVLRTAAKIEPNHARLMQWYRNERIESLGHFTAAQLVDMGRASVVIDFLRSIRNAEGYAGSGITSVK